MEEKITYQSPIGCLEIIIDKNEITALSIVSNDKCVTSSNSSIGVQIVQQLKEYFEGKRTEFNLPLRLKGTSFQTQVWDELAKIPYGETISYHELAHRVGNDKAYRAVGNANGKNPICLIVPCHRVIQSNGGIGGYAYGTDVKKFLLNLEKNK